jgi:hypothetical protein
MPFGREGRSGVAPCGDCPLLVGALGCEWRAVQLSHCAIPWLCGRPVGGDRGSRATPNRSGDRPTTQSSPCRVAWCGQCHVRVASCTARQFSYCTAAWHAAYSTVAWHVACGTATWHVVPPRGTLHVVLPGDMLHVVLPCDMLHAALPRRTAQAIVLSLFVPIGALSAAQLERRLAHPATRVRHPHRVTVTCGTQHATCHAVRNTRHGACAHGTCAHNRTLHSLQCNTALS